MTNIVAELKVIWVATLDGLHRVAYSCHVGSTRRHGVISSASRLVVHGGYVVGYGCMPTSSGNRDENHDAKVRNPMRGSSLLTALRLPFRNARQEHCSHQFKCQGKLASSLCGSRNGSSRDPACSVPPQRLCPTSLVRPVARGLEWREGRGQGGPSGESHQ